MRIYYPQDMTGKIFGDWTVLKRGKQKYRGNYYWLCKCKCGTVKEVDGNSLRLGRSLRCRRCSFKVDLTGKKFNYLTAISPVYSAKLGFTDWFFKCDCGKIKQIRGASVVSGSTKSCGCKQGLWSGLTDEQRMFNRIYTNYKYAAKSRELIFKLSLEEVSFLIKQSCWYCGDVDSNCLTSKRKNKYKFFYNGIDRLNSSTGYVKENCVPCCSVCNQMKMELGVSEFLNQINKISKFQEVKKSES